MNKFNLKETTSQVVTDFSSSLNDGNFVIIDGRFVLDLILIDEEFYTLAVTDTGDNQMNGADHLAAFEYKDTRYFIGNSDAEAETDDVRETYYSLIRTGNVEEFLATFK